MNTREEMATQLYAALIVENRIAWYKGRDHQHPESELAVQAVQCADMLIDALQKSPEELKMQSQRFPLRK
jgi:hypothetical protein